MLLYIHDILIHSSHVKILNGLLITIDPNLPVISLVQYRSLPIAIGLFQHQSPTSVSSNVGRSQLPSVSSIRHQLSCIGLSLSGSSSFRRSLLDYHILPLIIGLFQFYHFVLRFNVQCFCKYILLKMLFFVSSKL